MSHPCPDCGGTGLIWKDKTQVACTYCGRSGEMPVFKYNCRECVYAGEKEPNQPDEIWCALWGENRPPVPTCSKLYIRGVTG